MQGIDRIVVHTDHMFQFCGCSGARAATGTISEQWGRFPMKISRVMDARVLTLSPL